MYICKINKSDMRKQKQSRTMKRYRRATTANYLDARTGEPFSNFKQILWAPYTHDLQDNS